MWKLTFVKVTMWKMCPYRNPDWYKEGKPAWVVEEHSPHSITIEFERVAPVTSLMEYLSRKLINLEQIK